MLVFPDYDVKNRVNLEFPFDQELTGLIDEYVHRFRPTLLRGANELWLFPGETGGCKDAKTFSGQITQRVEKATGLFITVHQFRHAAAAIWLQHKPGDYETVRCFLGHRNIQTTINFYCGLETRRPIATSAISCESLEGPNQSHRNRTFSHLPASPTRYRKPRPFGRCHSANGPKPIGLPGLAFANRPNASNEGEPRPT